MKVSPDNVDWKEKFEFNKNHSELEQVVSVGDNDIDMLTKYEKYARYVVRNATKFGERVGSARLIDSKTVENVCYAKFDNRKVKGAQVLRMIERLSNDEVLVNNDLKRKYLYIPRETLGEIREIKREKNKNIRQRMLDSFENEAVAD